MKLLRYGPHGLEKPGILAATGEIRDLSGIIPDLAGESLLPRLSKNCATRIFRLCPSFKAVLASGLAWPT